MNQVNMKSKSIWVLIIGLILIGCGIFTLFNPISALIASAMIAGILFILVGIGYMMEFKECHSYMGLAIGLLDVLIGLVLLFNLGLTAMTIPIMFGLWCLFIGIVQLITAIREKENQGSFGNWLMGAGIVGILFGLSVLFYPLFGAMTVTFLMGAYLILYGAFEINRYIQA